MFSIAVLHCSLLNVVLFARYFYTVFILMIDNVNVLVNAHLFDRDVILQYVCKILLLKL